MVYLNMYNLFRFFEYTLLFSQKKFNYTSDELILIVCGDSK